MRRTLRALVVATLFTTVFVQGNALSVQPEDVAHERFRRQQRRLATASDPEARFVRRGAAAAPSQAQHFRVLGRLNLPGKTPHGDVFLFDHGGGVGKHAYVGTWSFPCSGTGVKIIDVGDPTEPALVATTPMRAGVSHEDMVVHEIGGRDILAVGIQPCGKRATRV